MIIIKLFRQLMQLSYSVKWCLHSQTSGKVPELGSGEGGLGMFRDDTFIILRKSAGKVPES